MNVSRDIFRAIHERKWLAVEYRNRADEVTRYWVGIRAVDPRRRTLEVRGMHLGTLELADLTIRIDAIQSSSLVDNSYFEVPRALVDGIEAEPERYQPIFGATPNLKVLDYLADCAKLNTTPCTKEFGLVERIDEDSFANGAVRLDDAQYRQLIDRVRRKSRTKQPGGDKRLFAAQEHIALNVLSVHTRAGLYVIAYRELRLDVERRQLAIGRNTIMCREFNVRNGRTVEQQSIMRYLDETDLLLTGDFARNRETLKDRIATRLAPGELVDDEPHVMVIARNMAVNLQPEYDAICAMYDAGTPTVPIKAFFGDLTKRPIRRKEHPMVVLDRRINLDQLLATHQALKYPLTYVQGPPGTGKTTTIVNILVNMLFNDRTVLFASYNNHPVDGVFESLSAFMWGDVPIPFPAIRLGDRARVLAALDRMRQLYEEAKDAPVLDGALRYEQAEQRQRSKQLTTLLRAYEERLDLQERKECLEKLAETTDDFAFGMELQGRQLQQVNEKLAAIESADATLERALSLTEGNTDELLQHLYHLSLRHIRRLSEPRSAPLLEIVMSNAPAEERIGAFNRFIGETANLKTLLRVFPIVATTCISARRLGEPDTTFDLTVIDEASQCDTATALIPIVRGRNLALVGDPQQLRPVVTIDDADNAALRRSYRIPPEYDFVENSAYKAFLACDSVSNEILLREHYRCDEGIIEFNNRKYYNGKLQVKSGRHSTSALRYRSVQENSSPVKNTAPVEADAVVSYVLAALAGEENGTGEGEGEAVGQGKGKGEGGRAPKAPVSIGVITPFANQRDYLRALLDERGLGAVTCGTVHAFQGDEKRIILFSLALTDRTTPATYAWLANNRELINVATSRARDELVIFSSDAELERLHATAVEGDDLYELVQYVKTNGTSAITPRVAASRALGIKPYSTRTENAFLENLNHALGNIFTSAARHVIHHEVPIAHVFGEASAPEHLFYSGRFDFVVYEVAPDKTEVPILAIELDGREHRTDDAVARRDAAKQEICARYALQLIRVENSYARRYHYIKEILEEFFKARR